MTTIALGQIEEMFTAYLTCELWSGLAYTDEDSEPTPLDAEHGISDIAPETLASLFADCISFLSLAESVDLAVWADQLGWEQIGHDFSLTRNRHGAGFWDRFYGETPEAAAGERLSAVARTFGASDLYVGDDGRIYT